MQWWSFYDPQTGAFSERCYAGSRPDLNTPKGMVRLAGQYDHLTQRVDLVTGKVVEKGVSPADDSRSRTAISLMERGSIRALREGLLELLSETSPTRQRVQEIDNAIAAERANIKE